uniref:Mohawk homeobox b n=1 Tax=Hippocampus comes TaxID=109280 RepID=A0A3Q3D329_HIPCM
MFPILPKPPLCYLRHFDSQKTAEESPRVFLHKCSELLKSSRSRLGGVKVRHKRQVLQDMARPLKHWLYKHRDNPYPTKTEKVLLALGSHMTLVQVSNWFANARRRLKNTVRQPDLSWALRIKLYNKYIQGNAERLSVCSDDTDSDGEGDFHPVNAASLQTQLKCISRSPENNHRCIQSAGGVLTMADPANSDDSASPPSKYKSSLLNRYLNDTLRHMMAGGKADGVALKRRSHSESFSSNECDRDAVSPASSSDTETNFIYQMGKRLQSVSGAREGENGHKNTSLQTYLSRFRRLETSHFHKTPKVCLYSSTRDVVLSPVVDTSP